MGINDSLFASFNSSQNDSQDQSNIDQSVAPDYLIAADNHNLGNIGESWWDVNPLNLPKFAAVSITSGLNSIYNTGIKIGNFFGADAQESKTEDVINSIFGGLDSDLGQYYIQHQQGADLAGFLVTSLVPGIGGIKILNAGQKALAAANEGLVGTNLGLALGLRTPQIESYILSAGKEIATGQAAFTSITSSATKALSLGIYQNVLEGAAFETAVQATMQASPILQDQDWKDIAWNIGTAGLFGGVLGGAFQSAKTLGDIRRTAARISDNINPFGQQNPLSFLNTGLESDKIVSLADDLEHGPVLNPGDSDYQEQLQALNGRNNRINLAIRDSVNNVAGKDNILGNQVADFIHSEDATTVMNKFLDTDQIVRLQDSTRVESKIAELEKEGLDTSNLGVQYLKLQGDNMGTVLDSVPEVSNLADRFGSKNAILSDVRDQGFKISDQWNAAKQPTGGATGHLDAERRQIWASELLKSVPDESIIGAYDFPVLERALQDRQLNIKIQSPDDKIIKDGFGSGKELQDYLISAKEDAAAQLQIAAIKAGKIGTNDEQAAVSTKIAKITNTSLQRLEGTQISGDSDYFAWQNLSKQRKDFLASKGISPVKGAENDPRFMPSWAKITKIIRDKSVDGNELDGFTYIREQQKLAQQGLDNVFAKQAPELAQILPTIKDTWLARANALGTGAGKFTINNPGYDSLGSAVSLIGSKLADYARGLKDAFSADSAGPLAALARKQDAVIEWSSLLQRTSRSAQRWIKYAEDVSGPEDLTPVYDHYLVEAGEFNKVFGANGSRDLGDIDPENLIKINNKEVGELADAHAQQTRLMIQRRNERASAMGADQAATAEINGYPIFRPIPPNPKDYPFFAFVKDPTVTSQGHTSMIFAQSDKELRDKVAAALRARPELDIHYKSDTEDFFRARHEYEYDRTLSENYIDSTLKNSGIYSDYFAKTDPQRVVDDYLQHHTRLIDTDARELIRSKYSAQFDWLEDQAKSFSRVETSKFGGNFAKLEAQGNNPYLSYIKTALNLSRTQEAPLWYNINKYADDAVSSLVGKIQDIWGSNKVVGDKELEAINDSLQKYGMNTGYYDAATKLLVNHQAPRAVLTKFVRSANSILARLTLGLDPLNGLVNALGANILRSTELKQLTDAVAAGDSDIAGKLAGLSKIDITGNGDLIRSPTKLMATAMKDFFDKNSPNHALFDSLGLQKGYGAQFRSIIGDDLALRGTESISVLQSKIRDAIAKANVLSELGQKYTGNKLAEEFNRFVSARSIQLLTDPAVDKGLISREEQYAYMNTFVNRVEGNLVASQRPFAFQGPIGQAIGLFQSYQFNLMQQMFRYVAEGSAKDAAMLLGLQGTFFGIQGLPAFQAINQHIIGTASGNPKHIDAYDAIYGAAGKNLGDILTYGLPSKLLSTNLYSRGDVNPRQLTVIPTALNEVPFVGAFTQFANSLKEAALKIGSGANVWESILQAFEHNGVSRPLSGIAQTLQSTTGNGTPFSTTTKGSIEFSNDLFSLATLTRLAGGRPLDEAIANDAVYRIHSYQQYDTQKMQLLSEAIKASSIEGQQSGPGQWSTFLNRYQAAGGKQIQFNKFMVREIKAANQSAAQNIISGVGSPYGQSLQRLMGDGSSNVQQLDNY